MSVLGDQVHNSMSEILEIILIICMFIYLFLLSDSMLELMLDSKGHEKSKWYCVYDIY